jgi:polyferredoxin
MKNDELTEILDRSFSAEPNFRLPDEFAHRVTTALIRREQWRTDLQEYFYLTAILIVLMVAASGIYYLLDKELLIGTMNFIKSNIVPVAFMFFFLNFILFADKVLLRLLFSRWKTSKF